MVVSDQDDGEKSPPRVIRQGGTQLISPIQDPPGISQNGTSAVNAARRNLNLLLNGGNSASQVSQDGQVSQRNGSEGHQNSGHGQSFASINNTTNFTVSKIRLTLPFPIQSSRGGYVTAPGAALSGATSARSARQNLRLDMPPNVSHPPAYPVSYSYRSGFAGNGSDPGRTNSFQFGDFRNQVAQIASQPAAVPVIGSIIITDGNSSQNDSAERGRNSLPSGVRERGRVYHPGALRTEQHGESRSAIAIASFFANRENLPRPTLDIAQQHYNPRDFDPRMLTFKQALRVMATFDYDTHCYTIARTFCMYTLRIFGLEDCPVQDLRLAVFFFIETHFKIQPAIELCVRNVPDSKPNVVGVVFENISTKQEILEKRSVLNGTSYRVKPNWNAEWIIENYDYLADLQTDSNG